MFKTKNMSVSKRRLFYNTSLGLVDKVIVCVMGLVVRRLFLHNLGAELSGLSSLFQNVIEFLKLTTAGFSAAIIPKLYYYNATNDFDCISAIMRVMKKFYYCITLFILALGIVCSFFLGNTIRDNLYTTEYLQVVFMLQVIAQCIYMLTLPNQSLLTAREQGYVCIIIDIFINCILYFGQIIAIVYTHNYVVYLTASLVSNLLFALVLYFKVRQMYPWLRGKVKEVVIKFKDIIKDLKYTVIMQIANFIFNSTDSIVLSGLVGLIVTNAYGNYMTIATAASTFFTAFEAAVKNYFGNKLAKDSSTKDRLDFLKITTLLFFVLGTVFASIYSCLISDFVTIWIGNNYIQTDLITIMFGIYIYVLLISCAPQQYVQNFGLFKSDMFANIIAASINIVLSVILVINLGIAGVLIGTIVGFLVRYIYRIYICFKDMDISVGNYLTTFFIYNFSFLAIMFLSFLTCKKIDLDNAFISLILKGFVSFSISAGCSILSIAWKPEIKLIVNSLKFRKEE